jgi:hypothetical protein
VIGGEPIVGDDGEDAVVGEIIAEVAIKGAVSVPLVAADKSAPGNVNDDLAGGLSWLVKIELLARIGAIGDVRDPGPGETPIPGALPLFMSGAAMLGGLVYRRRRL